MSGKVTVKISLDAVLKDGAENAANDDLRSLDNLIEKLLKDYLTERGYLTSKHPNAPQASQPLSVGKQILSAGKLIRDARKRLGISQTELAKRCGVTKGGISQWENDIGAPKRPNARKLATVLGLDPLELEARLSGGARGKQQ